MEAGTPVRLGLTGFHGLQSGKRGERGSVTAGAHMDERGAYTHSLTHTAAAMYILSPAPSWILLLLLLLHQGSLHQANHRGISASRNNGRPFQGEANLVLTATCAGA